MDQNSDSKSWLGNLLLFVSSHILGEVLGVIVVIAIILCLLYLPWYFLFFLFGIPALMYFLLLCVSFRVRLIELILVTLAWGLLMAWIHKPYDTTAITSVQGLIVMLLVLPGAIYSWVLAGDGQSNLQRLSLICAGWLGEFGIIAVFLGGGTLVFVLSEKDTSDLWLAAALPIGVVMIATAVFLTKRNRAKTTGAKQVQNSQPSSQEAPPGPDVSL